MQIPHPQTHLLDQKRRRLLRQPPPLLQQVVDHAVGAQLHEQVDELGVVEEAEQVADVGVGKAEVDFYLAGQLLLHVLLFDLGFGDLF
jgi:hypothetical protein